MKKLLLVLLIAFSAPVFAIDCPNANAFKGIKFDLIEKGDHPGVWTLTQTNHAYDTKNQWKFSLMIDADTQAKAMTKANNALKHLRKWQGPEKVDKVWVCDYKSKQALSAVATSEEKK